MFEGMSDFDTRPAHCTNCIWEGLINGGDALGGWDGNCSICGETLVPGTRLGSVAAGHSPDPVRAKRRNRSAPLTAVQRDRVVQTLLAEARERAGLKPMPPIPEG